MKEITEYIPMSETAYYILLSLTEERHGYAIMQYVSGLTKNRINLGAGTLYGTLSKLEQSGLVMITGEESKRKYYKITVDGEAVLGAELRRIEELYLNGREIFGYGK
jgi:DNA-binding PadR family transcriptional regulator